MPEIYLSPSTQEYNPYIDGGNEEYYMNLIADAMEPYLTASGIEFTRNDPSKTVGNSIAQSNTGKYDFHLAIHSNAAAGENSGKVRGAQVYYFEGSPEGKKAADLFAENFRAIYPAPELVRIVPTTTLAELRRTKATAILIEVAFHDNRDDADWIRENIGEIAENLSLSTAEYLGVEFRQPGAYTTGTVTTESSSLNLRSQPDTSSTIIGKIPKGAIIPIAGQYGEWYLTRYRGAEGYAYSKYITINE